jgi:hypothetical protein
MKSIKLNHRILAFQISEKINFKPLPPPPPVSSCVQKAPEMHSAAPDVGEGGEARLTCGSYICSMESYE